MTVSSTILKQIEQLVAKRNIERTKEVKEFMKARAKVIEGNVGNGKEKRSKIS
tara:strand:+ start:666 stop:824 length:159 start_codon:yes stop_codon:yes gene_type:complete